jgi:hypothetical protein
MRANTEKPGGGVAIAARHAATARDAVGSASEQTVALIRKLRWIGEESEAGWLEHALRTCTRLDTTDPVLYETD